MEMKLLIRIFQMSGYVASSSSMIKDENDDDNVGVMAP